MHYGSLVLSIEDAVPPIVRASGELDAESSRFFESILKDALRQSPTSLDLVLADLTFVDSSGLRALVTAAIEANGSGRSLNIASMSAHLDHMLTLAGFKHLFAIGGVEQTPDEAAKPGLPLPPYSFDIPKGIGACRIVRDRVHDYAEKMGFGGNALDDIRLAIGEAMSNAIRHGAVSCENVNVRCENRSQRLIVTLRYPSAEFDPSAIPIPTYSTAAEGGMGIYFMKLVMDEVVYEFLEGSTVLTLEKAMA